MYPTVRARRANVDLALGYAIGVILFLINLVILYPKMMLGLLGPLGEFPSVTILVHVLSVWLAVLLAVAFTRWRTATRKTMELEAVISSISPDALLVVNPDRTIFMCNDSVERLFGYAPQELHRQKTDVLYYDRRANRRQRGEIYEALEAKGFHIGQATGRRKDGTLIPLEIITGHLSGRSGAVLLLRDISERIRADGERARLEAQVQHRQKLESLGLMAGGVAHDFNSLLTVILGNVDVLGMDLSSKEGSRPIDSIRSAANKAADLCRNMLAYAGKAKLTMENVHLSALVSDMGRLLASAISPAITIEYRLAESLPTIEADRIQIQQVVLNLMTNAADAIGDRPGTITLTTGEADFVGDALHRMYVDEGLKPGRFVYLKAADTGCGMDGDTKAKLFDPFFTTKATGRGLGLAIVMGIVRGHHGTIGVESDLGKGSTFTVLFPCARS